MCRALVKLCIINMIMRVQSRRLVVLSLQFVSTKEMLTARMIGHRKRGGYRSRHISPPAVSARRDRCGLYFPRARVSIAVSRPLVVARRQLTASTSTILGLFP